MWRRDKLARQLGEAEELRRGSDRRMERVEGVVKDKLGDTELQLFRSYIARRRSF